jgi:hypothetical protein
LLMMSGLQRSTVTVLVLLDHKTIHSASFPTNLQAQRLLATWRSLSKTWFNDLAANLSSWNIDTHTTALIAYLVVFNDLRYLCNLRTQCTTWTP